VLLIKAFNYTSFFSS